MRRLRTCRPIIPLIASLMLTTCSEFSSVPPEVNVYVASVSQVEDAFRYYGLWSRRPDAVERSVWVGEYEFFTDEAGRLRMQRRDDRKVKEFNPFHAASAQGHMPPSAEGLPMAVHGFHGGGGRIWLGTGGVGILSYEPVADLWARYDVKAEAIPGWQSRVLYADDRYVFAEISPFEGQAGSGVCVFSLEDETWYEIASVSRSLLAATGYSESREDGAVDHRSIQDETRVPVMAGEVALEGDSTYVLRTTFSNGTETRFEIPAALLAQAL